MPVVMQINIAYFTRTNSKKISELLFYSLNIQNHKKIEF